MNDWETIADNLSEAGWSWGCVWGGWDAFTFFNTGGRYNPDTDSWTATNTTHKGE